MSGVADLISFLHDELDVHAEMVVVANRRGVPVNEVLLEAMQDFLAKDLLRPKSASDDAALGFPAGESGALSECVMRGRVARLPSADSCPPESIDAWLAAIFDDRAKLTATLAELTEPSDADMRTKFAKVLNDYDVIKNRLLERKYLLERKARPCSS